MNAWGALKQAVKDAPADSTIKITGTIQAATASGNYGELEITKNLSIKPTGSTATLDANNMSRIFKVTGGKFQLWNNMVLQNGNAGENEGGSFTMEGIGESYTDYNNNIIKGNMADKSGGGVAVHGAMTMNGGSIKNNKAKDGGCGIFLWYSQSGQTTLTMTNGFIASNDMAPGGTGNKGKGVYFSISDLTMKMSGYARISGDNDVYLTDGAKITVDSASLVPTSLGNVARITPKTYNAGTQVLTGNYVSTHNGKFKVTPNAGTNWSVGSNGYLKTS